MRLMQVNAKACRTQAEVQAIARATEEGKAVCFQFRPAPPPEEQVFAEARRQREAEALELLKAEAEARKPYGRPLDQWRCARTHPPHHAPLARRRGCYLARSLARFATHHTQRKTVPRLCHRLARHDST